MGGSEHRWAVNAGLLIVSILSLAANSLLLVVFFRRRGLRTVSNRFVINLLLTNLLSGIFLIPLMLADQAIAPSTPEDAPLITKAKTFNTVLNETLNSTDQTVLCYIAGGGASLVCAASILSILLIGVDQYLAVVHPLRYHAYMDRCKSLILLCATWMIAFSFGALGALAPTESGIWRFCRSLADDKKTYGFTYGIIYLTMVICIPLFSIWVLYMYIYSAAHHNSERMRRSTSGNSATNLDAATVLLTSHRGSSEEDLCEEKPRPSLPKVKSAPSFSTLDVVKPKRPGSERPIPVTGTNLINSLKVKFSNASIFRYREETRAAKISVLVIVMVLVCYVPYGLTLALSSMLSIPRAVGMLSLVLLSIGSVASPFLFAYRNRRVRRELRRVFGLVPKKTECRILSVKAQTFLEPGHPVIPEVVVTSSDRKSILKKVCRTWSVKKLCPIQGAQCLMGVECRSSFSSSSTQTSSEDHQEGT